MMGYGSVTAVSVWATMKIDRYCSLCQFCSQYPTLGLVTPPPPGRKEGGGKGAGGRGRGYRQRVKSKGVTDDHSGVTENGGKKDVAKG